MSAEVVSVASTTFSNLAPNAGGWAIFAASIATSLAIFRRRLSRDKTEMTKDRLESTFLEGLMARAVAAEQVISERAINLAAIARLEATNESQARDIERLKLEFKAFKRLMVRLYPDAARFLTTQQGDFEEIQR